MTPPTLPIQLFSTDFDGTLHADDENPPVPRKLEAMIASLQGRGMLWAVNTGRDLSSVLEGLARARLSIQPDYLVVVERHVYRREGPHYVELEEWNRQCERDHAALFDQIRPDMPGLVDWIDARYEATLYEDEFSPFCLIAGNTDGADAIHQYLNDYASRVSGLTVVRNHIYARFSHERYNKGSALAEIARRHALDPGRIAAAGDHFNDLPMLRREIAAHLIAPANAIDAVKDAVRSQQGYISGECWGHGVAQGLEYWLQDR